MSYSYEQLLASPQGTASPRHEATDWVLVIDTTNDERSILANKPQWEPRAAWEAYQVAPEKLSRFTNRAAA